jgi:hypothetical protein
MDMRNEYPKPLMETALTWPPALMAGSVEESARSSPCRSTSRKMAGLTWKLSTM